MDVGKYYVHYSLTMRLGHQVFFYRETCKAISGSQGDSTLRDTRRQFYGETLFMGPIDIATVEMV